MFGNASADLSVQISAVYSEEVTEKLKRNAFVFVTAEPDSTKSALEDLRGVEGVTELYLSRDAYDFIVKICGVSVEYLLEIMFKRIKNLSSIQSTLTLMVI